MYKRFAMQFNLSFLVKVVSELTEKCTFVKAETEQLEYKNEDPDHKKRCLMLVKQWWNSNQNHGHKTFYHVKILKHVGRI